MAAVDDLLAHLRSIERAVDALSDPAFADPAITEHLMRGASVHGLACVEGFIRARIDEWVSTIMNARIPPSRLPGGTKKYEDRVVEVLPRVLRDCDALQRSILLEDVGKSLTSLSSGVLVPHGLAFSWSGSNMLATDIESIGSLLGYDRAKVWSELTRLWTLVDKYYPGNSSLKSVYESIADLRHTGAHKYSPAIPLPTLATLTRNVKLVCLCVDAMASTAIRQMIATNQLGRSGQLALRIRRIVKDGTRWPEYAPGSNSRAVRRHATLEDAMSEATGRARISGELVLAADRSNDILDWRYPIS